MGEWGLETSGTLIPRNTRHKETATIPAHQSFLLVMDIPAMFISIRQFTLSPPEMQSHSTVILNGKLHIYLLYIPGRLTAQ